MHARQDASAAFARIDRIQDREPRKNRALAQRARDQPEMVALEIAQPAMDKLGRSGRSRAREIVLLDEHDLEPAAGGIARNATAVDPATDDGDVVYRLGQP